MKNLLGRFVRDDEGQDIIEYRTPRSVHLDRRVVDPPRDRSGRSDYVLERAEGDGRSSVVSGLAGRSCYSFTPSSPVGARPVTASWFA